jgi:hypothetical protein
MVSRSRTARSTTVCSRCVSAAGNRTPCESNNSALPRIPLDGVFQFAHVARPVISHHPRDGIFGNRAHPPVRLAEFLQERIHQYGYVCLSFTQRRDLDLHHVQPEKEILPKSSLPHRCVQIAVRRRDDRRRKRYSVRRTHRTHFLLLQRAQQLGLHIKRQISDFIQKQSSAVGDFHQSLLRVQRSRERAFHAAE